MAIEITGSWDKGLAFDVHTLSSTYLGPDEHGHDQFENVRSEMGELVYQLKYRHDRGVLPTIVDRLEKVKGIENFDAIIPIPPTNKGRAFQPVTEIANALGAKRGVAVLTDVLTKQPGRELKNVDDPDERTKLLEESLAIDNVAKIAGKKVLLVDDLYRSGATLAAATRKLRAAGAAYVGVLTMTKTRSKR